MGTKRVTFDEQAIRRIARLYREWLRKQKKDNKQ